MANEQVIREIRSRPLDVSTVDTDPMVQFKRWYADAVRSEIFQPDAMHLSTRNSSGAPTGRYLIYKEPEQYGLSPSCFLFFTSGLSPKAAQIDAFPQVALTFFWPELQRQIRVLGSAQKAPPEISDQYFAIRPEVSKIAAWASALSEAIESRSILEERALEYREKFQGAPIPRPPYWGGFIVIPQEIEFWRHRDDRLHDRIRYGLQEESSWQIERLSP